MEGGSELETLSCVNTASTSFPRVATVLDRGQADKKEQLASSVAIPAVV